MSAHDKLVRLADADSETDQGEIMTMQSFLEANPILDGSEGHKLLAHFGAWALNLGAGGRWTVFPTAMTVETDEDTRTVVVRDDQGREGTVRLGEPGEQAIMAAIGNVKLVATAMTVALSLSDTTWKRKDAEEGQR